MYAVDEINKADYYVDYLLNFGTNQQFVAVNVLLDGNEVLFKLYQPLPLNINTKSNFWVVQEKVNPYMMPLYDCMKKLGGDNPAQKDIITSAVEVAPLAYMRGRTFDDSVCIFDEAQNATKAQLKLFLTRFGKNSKVIITGDPYQSDLNLPDVPLVDVMRRLETLPGVGIVVFKKDAIVRHSLVSSILERLEE